MTFNSYQRENAVKQVYLYNSKELQDELNLSVYDYGVRMYDPAIGRWWAVDPLTELSRKWSPYSYCYNNPLIFVDPDGMFGEYFGENGKRLGKDGNDDGKVYVVTDKKEAKAIAETDDNGGTTQVDQITSEVELPSAYVRGEMGKAVDRSNSANNKRTDEFKGDDDEGGFHEEGGVYGQTLFGEESVVHAKPGAKTDPKDAAMASVAPDDPADPSKDNLEVKHGSFHVHPSGVRSPGPNTIGSTANFTQTPTSPDDYNEAKNYSGNSYVLGAGNGTVYIYNGNSKKPIATFPLTKFRSIGN